LFGFPAAGGTRDGTVVRYVLISQQKTMLGEPDGTTTARVQSLQRVFDGAGFPTTISAAIGGWLLGHAAFVVPIAFALSRVGGDAATLAADRAVLRLMVLATREAFTALRRGGNTEVPTNLRILYSLPAVVVVSYWRRVFAGPRGELWFGAHSRAAPEEMRSVGAELRAALRSVDRPTPHLELLATDSERP
jgi:2-dehydropantoate 2-reductase